MAPTFSSVQAPETPATKAKADAESIAKSAKKRKREEEQNSVQETTEPPAKKKSKNVKIEADVAATPVAQQNGQPASSEVEVVKSTKKEKKDKKKSKALEEKILNGAAVEEPVKEAKQVKKERRSESVEGVDPAIPAAAITPKHDVNGQGTEQKAKKSKKDKKLDKERRSVSQERPKAELSTPAAAPAVTAGSSRAQQSSHVKSQASREASKPLTDEQRLETLSPFFRKTETFYLALSPCANDFPLEGLVAEHISPLLLTYHPPLGGVVLKYSNARLSETPGGNADDNEVVLSKAMDEYAVTFVYLTVDLVLFRPTKGTYLEGYVNLQNESLLGLVCYNYFNAAIERQRLPKDWRWQEDGSQSSVRSTKQGNGCWVDGSGEKVDAKVVFRVKDFEATAGGEGGAGSMNILGTLLSSTHDRKVDDEEKQRSEKGGRTK
ncbi:hypothetical protein LTR56_024645 [Elasticomyces elasticus]|nr:hypothetical protein LTR56_024645 [Elasticomyces elasticus]KAK3622229.1 hypothetical protein LTR22_024889 [Elasticomyces elasticus]KAK5758411.1 hypothetical protein LTS12_011433 [Elasticomyces elasticus]